MLAANPGFLASASAASSARFACIPRPPSGLSALALYYKSVALPAVAVIVGRSRTAAVSVPITVAAMTIGVPGLARVELVEESAEHPRAREVKSFERVLYDGSPGPPGLNNEQGSANHTCNDGRVSKSHDRRAVHDDDVIGFTRRREQACEARAGQQLGGIGRPWAGRQ